MPRVIVIVDDSEHGLATLELALGSMENVEIRTAGTAREALALFEDGLPAIDALVTDLELPRMDGFELIQRVRALPRFADLPIAVISGDSDPRTPERLRRLGVNTHLMKPYSPAA